MVALGGNNVNIFNKFKMKKQMIKLNVHRSVRPASLITLKKELLIKYGSIELILKILVSAICMGFCQIMKPVPCESLFIKH